MKVCIVGAGAIGGFLGARLAAAGRAQVSAVARGATLAALHDHGWRLRLGATLLQAPVRASADAQELGAQDLVVLAVKGPALRAAAPVVASLLGPATVVLPAMNGVPWWFCDGVPGFAQRSLLSLDADGTVAQAIALQRVVGCVVHASVSAPEPGLVQHHMGQGLIFGEPLLERRGTPADRAHGIAELFAHAGFEATVASDIRYEIWYKLWGNLTINPISALTGATADRILDDPLVREFCSATMREVAAIGARIGCHVTQSPEERHAVTRKLGALRPSMLQDVAAGRAIELDAIVAAVQEIARRVDVAAPNVDTLLGLTRLFARERGLYP